MIGIIKAVTGTIEVKGHSSPSGDSPGVYDYVVVECTSDESGNCAFRLDGVNTMLKQIIVQPNQAAAQPTDQFDIALTHSLGAATYPGYTNTGLPNNSDTLAPLPSSGAGAVNDAAASYSALCIAIGPILVSLSNMGASKKCVVAVIGRHP